jgi:hypothetical protein
VYGLEKEYAGRITFVRANIHNRETFALQKKYGFTATPEFFLVAADGTILGHWDEATNFEKFKMLIDPIVARVYKQSPSKN